MKAYGDVSNIIKQIRQIQRELGSITQSPYPCYWTRHKIPLVLTRIERLRKRPTAALKPENQWKRAGKKEYEFTGKKSESKFWDLDLQIDPIWMDWYRKQQLAQELISRGLNPTREVIVGLMTGDITVDAKAIASSTVQTQVLLPVASEVPNIEEATPTLIPTAPKDRPANQQMIMQLEDTFNQNGWTDDAIAKLLEHYKISSLTQLTQEQQLELILIAGNPEAARQWNDQAFTIDAEVEIKTITASDWENVIYPVFQQNKWNAKAIMAMFYEEYGITRAGELLKSQIDEVIELAKNSNVRSRWMPPS
jgi:hypothetical protein